MICRLEAWYMPDRWKFFLNQNNMLVVYFLNRSLDWLGSNYAWNHHPAAPCAIHWKAWHVHTSFVLFWCCSSVLFFGHRLSNCTVIGSIEPWKYMLASINVLLAIQPLVYMIFLGHDFWKDIWIGRCQPPKVLLWHMGLVDGSRTRMAHHPSQCIN
jgi:hypothetical protein